MSSSPNQTESPLDSLPDLRFKTGEVVVKLGESPEDWLLVHSSVIATTIPVLAPAFKEAWKRTESVVVPGQEAPVDVTIFSLKLVDDAWLLEGSTSSFDASNSNGGDFTQSIYGGGGGEWPGWDGLRFRVYPHPAAATAHKSLIAILYGYRPSFSALVRYGVTQKQDLEEFTADVQALVIMCAYASYYGCLDRFRPFVLDTLLTQPLIWRSIASSPKRYIAFGKKLHSSEMYFDALRHLIAQCNKDSSKWTQVAACLDISVEHAEATFAPELRALEAVTTKLKDDLLRLQLTPFTYYYDRSPIQAPTTFFNALKHKSNKRSEFTKARERFDLLARSTYGQWLVQKLVGEKVNLNGSGKPRGYPAGGLNNACMALSIAAKSNNPADMFGYKVASRLGSIFRLGKKYNSEYRVNQSLNEIVIDAAKLIDAAFATRTDTTDDGKDVVYRRCHFDAQDSYFTYLPLDESKIPWNSEVMPVDLITRPVVCLDEAEDSLVRILGGGIEEPKKGEKFDEGRDGRD